MRYSSKLFYTFAFLLLAAIDSAPESQAQGKPFILLASTTSTEQSGLFPYLLPLFTRQSGIDVRVVAVGTGQALKLGEKGDVDLLLVHDPQGEEKFVAAGFGVDRRKVMHNDFILLGPAGDPAQVREKKTVLEALRAIAEKKAPFVSRGDDSGTHRLERRLWKKAEIEPSIAKDTWYRETGSGMGPSLNVAKEMLAYILADRGTWLAFANKGDLKLLWEGDPILFNPYSVILVNPAKHPHVKQKEALVFMNWLTGADGQKAIAEYRINGQPLFIPDAGKN